MIVSMEIELSFAMHAGNVGSVDELVAEVI